MASFFVDLRCLIAIMLKITHRVTHLNNIEPPVALDLGCSVILPVATVVAHQLPELGTKSTAGLYCLVGSPCTCSNVIINHTTELRRTFNL